MQDRNVSEHGTYRTRSRTGLWPQRLSCAAATAPLRNTRHDTLYGFWITCQRSHSENGCPAPLHALYVLKNRFFPST